MSQSILYATNNPGKLKQATSYLINMPEYELVSLRDLNIDADAEETGLTLEEHTKNLRQSISYLRTIQDARLMRSMVHLGSKHAAGQDIG
jgi:inosine/xanthosine triphosphate pyrophosphatase family protein